MISLLLIVKGTKGKYAFEIKNCKGEQLHIALKENVLDPKGLHMWPNNTDFEAIIAGLNYIYANRGKNNIPVDSAILVYTTFENNYQVASGIKTARQENIKVYVEMIGMYKNLLRKFGAKDDTVKILFAPNDFSHHFDNIEDLLNCQRVSRKP